MPRPALKAATVQAAPISDLQAATPAEIDAHLARIWESQYAAIDQIDYYKRQVKEYNEALAIKAARQPGWLKYSCYTEASRDRCQTELDDYRAKLKALQAEAAPYEAEFTRRGGWHRYFLVLNGNGHVHRERNCQTCYPTTRYGWLYTLSDCDESAMVAEYGHVACSVCFPDAPVEEMLRAHMARMYCPGSGRGPKGKPWYSYGGERGDCAECGKDLKLTTMGTLPKHKHSK